MDDRTKTSTMGATSCDNSWNIMRKNRAPLLVRVYVCAPRARFNLMQTASITACILRPKRIYAKRCFWRTYNARPWLRVALVKCECSHHEFKVCAAASRKKAAAAQIEISRRVEQVSCVFSLSRARAHFELIVRFENCYTKGCVMFSLHVLFDYLVATSADFQSVEISLCLWFLLKCLLRLKIDLHHANCSCWHEEVESNSALKVNT